ncbi:MAG: sulfatase [Ginsengibacter sp.]
MKTILLILALIGNAVHINAQKQSQKPNVVIIFMDDMGYGDPDFNMGIGYTTPNIDRLGAEGMRFTNFYSAQGTCTASRAGILTGCYPNRIGLFGALAPWSETALNPKEETIANVLKNGGYSTCMVGKWHLGSKPPFLPTHFGFDQYLGLPYSNDMWPVNYGGKPITDTSNHRYNYPILPLLQGDKVLRHIRTLEDQGQLTQSYTRFATKFIKEHKSKPFFLYFANSMVHVPIAASPAFLGKSENGLFGDVMQEVDWSVGQIMKTLRDESLDKNTLVIFTSDNGPWLNYGNHAGNTGGLREGKGTSFEGGQREPCLMRWPGHIPAGTVCNKIASTIDLMPTITALSNSRLPEKKIDGINILPLLLGKPDADPRTEFVYYYNRNSLECIRQGKWKLVFPHKSRSYKSHPPGHDGFPGPTSEIDVPLALYDMSTDPGETLDVQEQHADVMKQLEALADKYRNDLGDDLTNVAGTGRRPAGVCTECITNIRKP